MSAHRSHKEQRVFQEITGLYDAPAFVRREQKTQAAWDHICRSADAKYRQLLTIPALRLGRLAASSENLQRLTLKVCPEETRETLRQLHSVLQPELRRRYLPASDAALKLMLQSVSDTFRRFNARWLSYVSEIQFDDVNRLRRDYNRYYVIEKEFALQSYRTAVSGFTELPEAGSADILQEFPPLPDLPDLPIYD